MEIVKATYNKYDELELSTRKDWVTKLCRHLSPFSLVLPYAIIQVLVHWLMLVIIGIRIYVDNFARKINDTTEIDTGEYKTTPYTRYMVFCGGYLLIASAFVYLVLNKYWFFEVYNFISTEQHYTVPLSVKLLAFMRDPMAYILVVLQVVPFIPFALGSFLPDYDNSEFLVAPGLRTAAHVLGWCFIGFFLLSNMQAIIICLCLSVVFGIIGIILAAVGIAIAVILLGYAILILYYCLAPCCKDDESIKDGISFSGIVTYTECVGESCKDCIKGFFECCIGCAAENLDWCWCTCDPEE